MVSVEDNNIWLEDVSGEKALEWVKERNETSIAHIGEPTGTELYDRILAILESKDKIPYVRKIGDLYYNFWQDDQHTRGIWRRTTWDSYQTAAPVWETVLDIDALGKEEGESWVYKGAEVLDLENEPRDIALLKLSRGGSDAVVVREFNLATLKFVEAEPFNLPESKTFIGYLTRDSVFVGTNFGEGSLTDSGYPRLAKQWKRGTPLSEAVLVYEGQQTDVLVQANFDREIGASYELITRAVEFFKSEFFIRLGGLGGELKKLNVPLDMKVDFYADQCMLEPRSDWVAFDGQTYPAGSLLAMHLDPLINPESTDKTITVIFMPTERRSLDGWTHTKDYAILTVLDNVATTLVTWKYTGEWKQVGEPYAGAGFMSISATALDHRASNGVFLRESGFISPSTLALAEVTDAGFVDRAVLKKLPEMFNSKNIEVSQHFTKSTDGTSIPYFQVGIPSSEPVPTILYGYGGFEISLTPFYMAASGAGWLEDGYSFVIANIRGGGEFGPKWHQAALKENRQKAYDDFFAVAEDLIQRGITTKEQLGCQGGSNGGLLTGNCLVMRPDLWAGICCQVPLLDMKRFHTLLAGASWMAEYGNPDTDDWSFLQKYSPYHNVKEGVKYPNILFATSTKDDRVHPGHARKMVKRLLDYGHNATTWYWENTEGGHSAAADCRQEAYMKTLVYKFFKKVLKK